jgi:NADH-ubiquinone oxidoreductase chain 2
VIILLIFIFLFIFSLSSLNLNLTSSVFRRLTAISLLSACVLIINTLHIQSIGSGLGLYNGYLEISVLSNIISLFILIISSIILIIWPNINILKNNFSHFNSESVEFKESYNNISNFNKAKQYSLIILFNLLGALLLISASDLISMYLSIELQSFGLYVLSTLYKEKLSSTSAGLKYFLLGGLSSCFILLGSGLIYTYTGLTNLELIYSLLSIYFNSNFLDLNGISIGIFLIFSGFLFKIAAAPFHNWSPDVYDDSPTLVTV